MERTLLRLVALLAASQLAGCAWIWDIGPTGLVWEEDTFDDMPPGLLDGENGWRTPPLKASPEVRDGLVLLDPEFDPIQIADKDVPDQESGRHVITLVVRIEDLSGEPTQWVDSSLGKLEIRTASADDWGKKLQFYVGGVFHVDYGAGGSLNDELLGVKLGWTYTVDLDLDLGSNRASVAIDGVHMGDYGMHGTSITELSLQAWPEKRGAVYIDMIRGVAMP